MAVPSDAAVRSRVLGLPRRFRSETVNGLAAEWELRIDDQVFTVTVGGHTCQSREGPGAAPNTTIWVDGTTWLAIDSGTLTGPQAFLQRRLKLAGNLDLAVRREAHDSSERASLLMRDRSAAAPASTSPGGKPKALGTVQMVSR